MKQPELGNRISDLRKAKGWTQKELAEQCKIGERTLQRIETGEVKPRAYTVSVIFDVLQAEHDGQNASTVKKRFKLRLKTRRTVWILSAIVFSVALVLTLFFATNGNCGCKRMPATAFTIDEEISDINPRVKIVKLVEQSNEAVFSENGMLCNKRLQINLPDTLPPNVLYRILMKHTKVSRSDIDAHFAFARMEGYDKAGNLIGQFKFHNAEKHIEGRLIYADRDVTLNGTDNSNDIWCASLKKGWNVIFFMPTNDGWHMNTEDPGGMKWCFQ